MRNPREKTAAALLALLFLLLATPAASGSSLQRVKEYGSLELHGSKGSTIEEHGKGWGSFDCSVSIRLTLSGTKVTASYVADPSGGAIKGTAVAYIHSATSSAARFSGAITLHGGSGRYSGAYGKASFDSTINRHSYAMSVEISGSVHL